MGRRKILIRKELPHITIKTNKELREYLVQDLELVNIPDIEHAQLTINAYRKALDKRNSFGRRLVSFLTGQSKLSRGIGSVLDFVTIFVPYGRQVKNARELIKLLLTRKEKPMLKKILSIKNFINVKDENGEISGKEIVASVIQLALATAVVYGVVALGIWNEFSQLLLAE